MVHSMFPNGLVRAKRKPMGGRKQQGPHCLENSWVRQPFLGGKVWDRGDLQQREDEHCCRTRHSPNFCSVYCLRLSPKYRIRIVNDSAAVQTPVMVLKSLAIPVHLPGMRNGDPKNRLLPSRYGLRATSATSGAHTDGINIFFSAFQKSWESFEEFMECK